MFFFIRCQCYNISSHLLFSFYFFVVVVMSLLLLFHVCVFKKKCLFHFELNRFVANILRFKKISETKWVGVFLFVICCVP